MYLDLAKRKKAFVTLGKKIQMVLQSKSTNGLTAAEAELFEEIRMGHLHNPWFTEENTKKAFQGISFMLEESRMISWLEKYDKLEKESNFSPVTVAVIMAGNIPFVGFHDMLCVLLSGHRFLGKLSSQDRHLPVIIGKLLTEAQPALTDFIVFEENIIKEFDAVIATGSNNSGRYFDYYFGKYPHIIRRNRSSLAVLTGNETKEELESLSSDIFSYFGMGCRNVSKIMVPEGYNITHLLDRFDKWSHLKDHHKFYNNYEYQKAIFLVNRIQHLDTGFSLVLEDGRLSSPLAVIHYTRYNSLDEVAGYIYNHSEKIQCVVASDKTALPDKIATVKPGNTQLPSPDDYADGVDTIEFLAGL